MVEYFIPKWEEIEEGILYIVEKMVNDNFIPDAIIAVLTGGVIPAKLIADALGVRNIKYIDIKFYKGIESRERKPVIKAVYVDNIENKKVLIIDDVADTGETLDAVSNIITMYNPSLVRLATVYVKPWSRKYPDYYYKILDKWIIFPWDKWEVVRENSQAPVDKKEKYLEILSKLKR
ncbi:phosphoribosyltransferase [Sulfurisphaera javensis]|uniref:Phosphoribosyltransferase n=1 Tax=Sulfurisphaera javensis TaxID=2049879 RepID=A0AAT9GS61_9CREN